MCLPRSARFALVVFFALPCLVIAGSAQDDTPVHLSPAVAITDPSLDASSAISYDVNLVLVPVVVTDSYNHPVLGLPKDRFALFEDKRRQQIEYFFSEDAPMSIGLVLDFSGSMETKIDLLREAVEQFFINANGDDEYYVVAVSTHPTLLALGTRSLHQIDMKLSKETPTGATALYDAVDLTMRMMRKTSYQRRVIVIISDGNDTDSRLSKGKLIRRIQESNIDVYGVGIFDTPLLFLKPLDVALGKRSMAQLTDASGGRTIVIENDSKLPETMANLSKELRSRYILGYRPTKMRADGKWRNIKVSVKPAEDRSHFQAIFKKGYFAPQN